MLNPIPSSDPEPEASKNGDRFPSLFERKKRHFANSTAEFARMGTHLVNQLLGRRNSKQLELFSHLVPQLKPETKLHAQFDSIRVVGFDLTVDQQRALQAGLSILNSPLCKNLRAIISRKDWLDAFGLPVNNRQSDRQGGDDLRRAFQALDDLGTKVWLIYYERQNQDGSWKIVEEPGAKLLSLRREYDFLTADERDHIDEIRHTPHIQDKLQSIEIAFHPIWLDQAREYYTKIPLHLHTQYYLLRRSKKPPKHVYNFTIWVIDQMTRKYLASRNSQGGDWRVSISTLDLAHLCRMQSYIEKRQNNRIYEALTHDAEFAKDLGYITDFHVTDQIVIIQLNADKAREIHETGRVDELRKAAEEPRRKSRVEILMEMEQVKNLISHIATKLTLDLNNLGQKDRVGFLLALTALAKPFHERGMALSMSDLRNVLTTVSEKILSHAKGGIGGVNNISKYFKKSLLAYIGEHFDELYDAGKRFRDLQDPTSRTYSKKEAGKVASQVALFEYLANLQNKKLEN